jgi:hypothetical protein
MQTMNSGSRPPVLTFRFLLLMSGVGAMTGLILALVDAPLWAYYAASIVMAPFMFHEFRGQEAAATESELRSRRPAVSRKST